MNRRKSVSGESSSDKSNSEDFNTLAEEMSSKFTMTFPQFCIFLLVFITFAGGLYAAKEQTIVFCSVIFSAFYLMAVLFRAVILSNFDGATKPPKIPLTEDMTKTYVVMAALYKESGQVPALIEALGKLKWPNGKIHKLLVCEKNDHETINAISRIHLPAGFHLIVVPEGKPQTKPRALNYALGQINALGDFHSRDAALADFLVIYDAEDRPHPNQLLEAAMAFSKAPEEMVCL